MAATQQRVTGRARLRPAGGSPRSPADLTVQTRSAPRLAPPARGNRELASRPEDHRAARSSTSDRDAAAEPARPLLAATPETPPLPPRVAARSPLQRAPGPTATPDPDARRPE